jgi:cytochrome c biogenesis protein
VYNKCDIVALYKGIFFCFEKFDNKIVKYWRYVLRYSNRFWKFFVSVKLTVVLLLSLAATSIVGTVIPQNENPATYFRAYGEFVYKLFDFLGLFDMYHSWWFQFLILLLTINILICSMDRLSTIWKIIFVKNPLFNLSRFRALSQKEVFTAEQNPEALSTVYERVISGQFGYTRMEETDNGVCIFAEKWRWTRLGVYIVHLSVILLLLGGLIGSLFGFEGFAIIPEHEKINSIRIRNTGQVRALGFEVLCDDFNISFYDNGTPKEYKSSLTIIEQGKAVSKKDIIVNHPLRYKGINIFQSSYGKLPPGILQKEKTHKKDPPENITLNIVGKASGKAYKIEAVIGKPVDLPEGLGKFVIVEYQESAEFGGQNIGRAYLGILTPKDKAPVNIMLPLHFPNFDKMRRGAVVISVAAQDTKTFNPGEKSDQRYYTGLQITKDPGIWVVYTGFIGMIIGIFITFFMSHQRVCIDIVKKGKQSQVMVTGTANKNKLAMQNKIKNISEKLINLQQDT